MPTLLCRSCFPDLTQFSENRASMADDDVISVIETAYRSALLRIESRPGLIDDVTS
jgi:hypothetical protein